MADEAVGSLFFNIGILKQDVDALGKDIEVLIAQTQARLNKNKLTLDVEAGDGFKSTAKLMRELTDSYKELAGDARALGKVLETVGKGSGKPLTEGQKAARAYAAELKGLYSEQRAGLKTQGDTVSRIKAITAELGKGLGALDKTSAEYADYANALDKATTTLKKLEAAQKSADQRLDTRKINETTNAYSNLRLQYENLDRTQDQFIAGSRDVYASFERLRSGADFGGTAYKKLTDQMRQVTTGIATAEERTTRLGLSQQVALGQTTRLTDGVKGLGAGVVNLGNALPGVIGVAGFGGLLSITDSLATQANALNVSYDILNLTLERTGQSSEGAQAAITEVAQTLGVAEGQVVDYLTQLTRVGFTTDEAAQALIAGGASALAFGKTAAQGMDSVTSALLTQSSAALNTIGIAENIGAAMGEAADGAAAYGEAASQQAAAQAGLEVILKATGAEVQSLDKLTGGLAGQQNRAATAAFEAKQALGEMLIPLETLKNEALAGVLGQFQELPSATQASVLGFSGVTSGVAALATGANALRLALAPLFAPPGGLVIGGIALAAGLGVAIYNAAQNFEPAAEKVKRLTEAAYEVPPGLDAIKNATSKEQLLGAVQTLAETMDGDARVAFTNYATDAVTSAETVGDAVLGVLQGIAAARKVMLEDAIDAQEDLLATLEENRARSQTNYNIATATGGDGLGSSEVEALRAEQAAALQEIKDTQAKITAAVKAGNEERQAYYQEQLAEDRAYAAQIADELAEALNNTPAGRLSIDTSEADEAKRDLDDLQERYDTLVDLLENGDASEIEAYFSAGVPGVQKLGRELGTGGDGKSGTGVNGALSTFQENMRETGRLVMSLQGSLDAQALKLRFDSDPTEGMATLRKIAETAAAAAQQALDEGKPARAAALFDLSDDAQTQLSNLHTTVREGLEPVDVAFAHTTGGAEDLSTFLSGMASRSNFAAFASSITDGSYAATTSVQSLTGATKEQLEALRQSQIDYRDTQVAIANASSTTDEYLAAMMRESKAWADRSRAQREQVNNWRELKEGAEALGDVTGKTADQYALQAETLQTVGDKLDVAANRFEVTGDAQAYTAEQASIYQEALNTLIDAGFDPLDPAVKNYAKLLKSTVTSQEASAKAAEKQQEAYDHWREGLTKLSDVQGDFNKLNTLSGKQAEDYLEVLEGLSDEYPSLAKALKPLIERTEEYVEGHKKYAKNLETTRDAQEALADAAGLTDKEISVLLAQIEAATKGTGELGAEARDTKEELIGLQEARKTAEDFAFLGEMSRLALENIPGLSEEGTAALGFLSSAGTEAAEILQDGFNGAGDVLSILEAGIQGVASAFGDDLSPKAQDALTVVGGAVEGAASGFAVGGPIGAAIGGLIGLFGGFGQAAADAAKRAEEAAKEAEKAFQDLYNTLSSIEDKTRDVTQGARDSAIDAAEASGASEIAILIAQTQADLVEAHEDYMQTLEDIDALEQQAFEDFLAAGYSEEEARAMAEAKVKPLRDVAQITYENTVTSITETAEQAANDLNVSDEAFYDALVKPSDILNGLIPGYESSFANFIAIANGGVHTLSTTMTEGGATLNASGRSFGVKGSQGLNDGAVMIGDTATSSFGSISNKVSSLIGNLISSSDGFGSSLSGGFLAMFGASKDAVLTGGQNLNTTLGTTFGSSEDALDDKATLLKLMLLDQEAILAERQKQLFEQQRKAALAYGPLASAELSTQVQSTKDALKLSLYGSNGFSPFLTTGTSTISSLLSNFFDSQRITVTRQAGLTVNSIDAAAGDIRRAMNSLLSASLGYGSRRSGSSSGRSSGGGGGSSGAFNAFQSLNETVDPKLLGGFGDEFSFSSLLYGGGLENEFGMDGFRDPFGYGTLARVAPESTSTSGFSRRMSTSLFNDIFNKLRNDSNFFRKGVAEEANASIRTVNKAKEALDDVISRPPTKKRSSAKPKKGKNSVSELSDEVKKTIEETSKAIADFQNNTFDIINGYSLFNVKTTKKGNLVGGLLKQVLGDKISFKQGLTDAQKGLLDFASNVGESLESGVSGGISSGIKDAIRSGELLNLEKVLDSLFDTTFDGLFDQVSDTLLKQALGPLLTDLTADVSKGDVAGSSANIQQIMARLPAVAAQIQAILAPLSATLPTPTGAINSTRTGGITLEQRSLGSASPTWVDTLGTTLSRVADRMFLAGERQYAAAVKLEAAATKAQTNASQERLNNGKTSKI